MRDALLPQFVQSRSLTNNWIDVLPGIRARYWNAGHLLGSASIEIEFMTEGHGSFGVLASGDIGPDAKLFQPDPEGPTDLDYVICKSTYGGGRTGRR